MKSTENSPPKENILIVDDNPANLNLLSNILSKQGYKIRAALSGTVALKSVRLTPPDLILLDILMPEIDGYAVCQALKASPITQDIPVIFISALNEVLDKVKAFSLGGVDYISKPFQTEEVLARVENQLRIQRLSKQLLEQNIRLQQQLRERQQAEQALQASQQQLELALEGSEQGWWDWNILTGEVSLSERWWQMLGYEVDELPGHLSTWERLIHPDDRAWVIELLDAHLQDSSVPYNFDYRFLTKSGEWKWIACYGKVVVRDELNKPLRMSGTHRDITEQKQAQEQIQTSLKEKEVLLKEIHHRVKNNLQIVKSLLQMQCRRTKEQEGLLVLQDSQNRIASIALVHEKLYRSDDLANIDFAQYIPDLTIHLFETYNVSSNTINLKIKVHDIALDIDRAIPCSLIINELVSNSLKYAFPANRKGEIYVEFYPNSDDTLTLTVRDNGIGIPEAFDIATATSLGLTLVQGLVEQLEGTLELDRSQGTAFKITFAADGNR
jgi:PAS domain S-box-containing protein